MAPTRRTTAEPHSRCNLIEFRSRHHLPQPPYRIIAESPPQSASVRTDNVDTNNDAGLPADGAGEMASRHRPIPDTAMAAAGADTPAALMSRTVAFVPSERE